MSTPSKVTVEDLEEWVAKIKEYWPKPQVPFIEDDPTAMLKEAYKKSQECLYYLNHRMRSFIPRQ